MRKIKICGDILVSEPFKKMARYLRHKDMSIQMVTCHSSTASVCSRFGRHFLV